MTREYFMKKTATLLFTALISTTTFAEDYIKCDFKILDNKVPCSLFSKCPQKDLRESRTVVTIVVNDGVEQNGKIKMKKVLLYPGTRKQDKYDITLFKDDKREEKLIEKGFEDITVYDVNAGIGYAAEKEGKKTKIKFTTPNYTFDLSLQGENASYSSYLVFNESAISFSCLKLNKEAFEDVQREKEAVEKFKEKEKEEKKSKVSAQ
jgi:hypothetical protein